MDRMEIDNSEHSGEWRTAALLLIGTFLSAGVVLVGWGIWDLLNAPAAQRAFADGLRAVGYGAAVLLVCAGLAVLLYGASHALRASTPARLARGVQEHGGAFSQDGLAVVLPPGFDALPPEAQREALASMVHRTAMLGSGREAER